MVRSDANKEGSEIDAEYSAEVVNCIHIKVLQVVLGRVPNRREGRGDEVNNRNTWTKVMKICISTELIKEGSRSLKYTDLVALI